MNRILSFPRHSPYSHPLRTHLHSIAVHLFTLATFLFPVTQGLEAIGLVDLTYDTTVILLESCRKLKLLDVRSCKLHIPTTAAQQNDEEQHQDISTRSDQWKNMRNGHEMKQNESYDDESPVKRDKQEALSVMFPNVEIVTKWIINESDDA